MKIYRAAETAETAPGVCFATSRDAAELFLSGADGGTEGRRIYSLDVEASPVQLETLAEVAELAGLSLAKWASYGWDRVWQALDSAAVTAALSQRGITWVSYEDEGPDGQGGLVCWRYYGSEQLEMKEEA